MRKYILVSKIMENYRKKEEEKNKGFLDKVLDKYINFKNYISNYNNLFYNN
jgi:hypothetical protein